MGMLMLMRMLLATNRHAITRSVVGQQEGQYSLRWGTNISRMERLREMRICGWDWGYCDNIVWFGKHDVFLTVELRRTGCCFSLMMCYDLEFTFARCSTRSQMYWKCTLTVETGIMRLPFALDNMRRSYYNSPALNLRGPAKEISTAQMTS